MKNIYQIRIIKDGHEQVFDKEITGTVDEVHIVSKAILKKELEAEMAAIERANSFQEKYLPYLSFGVLVAMAGFCMLRVGGVL